MKYQCKNCKLWYKNKKWAEKCGQWCGKHGTCNIMITKHRIADRLER